MNKHSKFLLPALLAMFSASGTGLAAAQAPPPAPREGGLLEVTCIWNQAPHNAFTDLIRYKGLWYCAFREGAGHVSADGKLRVVSSQDGRQWKSVASMQRPDGDLRDAKLSLTADGRLMLNGVVRFIRPVANQTHQSLTWLSSNGRDWSKPQRVGDPNLWLWSVAWHNGAGYSFGYSCGKEKFIRLYRTRNATDWETLVDKLPVKGYPNETSVVFDGNGTACCLLRRDGKLPTAQLGTAPPPYTDWTCKDLGVRIGGPKLVRLADGRLLAVVRLYDRKTRTALCWIDSASGSIREFLTLPSGGDTSYAGVVVHEGLLWISYYSSHEGKTSIYLAKVKLT